MRYEGYVRRERRDECTRYDVRGREINERIVWTGFGFQKYTLLSN